MKVQISISDNLMYKVDEICKNNYMTRSGYISYCLNEQILKNEINDCIKKLNKMIDGNLVFPEEEFKSMVSNLINMIIMYNK